ncbi:DUF3047 domain-containing protein [Piscinibacter koreensis]|uniref:DUF3047 domain-containing protein n=1 Tax=Piscinibacter koreensis TaxID=2742824 RepID=A0A7Y6NQ95_9BURK|nr:DUF3047 domain-containing protein [Schlegelella koreensis]NUZ07237.1 DUF3047 domain-containing protein [Schlegelella koreensis]
MLRRVLISICTALPLASASAEIAEVPALEPFPEVPAPFPGPWHVAGLPNQTKPFTRFALAELDGRRALRVEAVRSFGNLVHPLAAEVTHAHLSWQWRVDQLVDGADLRTRAGDDASLKVCVSFDLALERVPFIERQLLRYARARSREPIPAATICYVWDTGLAPGTQLDNAYTRRIRTVVLESGDAHRREWLSERRDIVADFIRLFGDESREVPPLFGVAVGADADNTQSRSLGYVDALKLEP